TLQTGMDNVRGIVGCPATGLTPRELLDTSGIAAAFQSLFLGNREFTNLPRKFNVTITGCLEHCTVGETQDISMTPALAGDVAGFNLAVGGKQGSGGPTLAASLDAFVRPEDAAEVCATIALIFRDHGPREARSRARLAFLLGERGAAWMREELVARLKRPLPPARRGAGEGARGAVRHDAAARRALVGLSGLVRQSPHRGHRAAGLQGEGERQDRGRRARLRRRPRRRRPSPGRAHPRRPAVRRAAGSARAARPLLPARGAHGGRRAPVGGRVMNGRPFVSFVGAGPGDPELVTLK